MLQSANSSSDTGIDSATHKIRPASPTNNFDCSCHLTVRRCRPTWREKYGELQGVYPKHGGVYSYMAEVMKHACDMAACEGKWYLQVAKLGVASCDGLGQSTGPTFEIEAILG